MSRLLCSALFALAAATTASAGPVYRIVNADGSVTFSDTPPASATGGNYAVVGNGGARGGHGGSGGQAAQTQAGAAAAPALEQPKRATGAAAPAETAPESAAPAAGATDSRPSAALEGAVIGVLGMEDIVARTEKLCVETLPTSFARYSDAAQRWRTRNASTLTLAKERLANEFAAPARALIATGIPLKNDAMFSPVTAAPTAARIQWCDQSFATIDGGTMDVAKNAKLTGPLTASN